MWCTHVNPVLACGRDDLPRVELESCDRMVVLECLEYATGTKVPYLKHMVQPLMIIFLRVMQDGKARERQMNSPVSTCPDYR